MSESLKGFLQILLSYLLCLFLVLKIPQLYRVFRAGRNPFPALVISHGLSRQMVKTEHVVLAHVRGDPQPPSCLHANNYTIHVGEKSATRSTHWLHLDSLWPSCCASAGGGRAQEEHAPGLLSNHWLQSFPHLPVPERCSGPIPRVVRMQELCSSLKNKQTNPLHYLLWDWVSN